ncbi:hypothetical protein CVIRNUC_003544 [Coccomyxa viridis]|uniref:Uncharacterized protein n=1 Tax=Coccomyxa viridis TaxID=1274662 RepID=A0AAV1I006_9CHLO|nr:hypothetical protein CVIRNUC_003544 [Coccomyxa viridis]
MVRLNEDFDSEAIAIVGDRMSSRDAACRYWFVRYADNPLHVETPRLVVTSLQLLEQSCRLVLRPATDDDQTDVERAFADRMQQIRTRVTEKLPEGATDRDGGELRVKLSRDAAGVLTDGDSGMPVDLEILEESELRAYIQLEGVAMNSRENCYWMVWTLKRGLVYQRDVANPLGKSYCFLDDGEYDSLSD